MTFNSSNSSFNGVTYAISCLLQIRKVVFKLLLTNSNYNFHDKLIG